MNSKDYLVLDYHACILSVIEGKEKESIKILRKIIRTDLNKIAYGSNGEGMNWAKSIVNDSRLRLALIYKSINKSSQALLLLDEHLKHRQRGVFSNFTKKDVINKNRINNQVFKKITKTSKTPSLQQRKTGGFN